MKQALAILAVVLLMDACCAQWRCHCGDMSERTMETVDSVVYDLQEIEAPIPEESAAEAVPQGDTSFVQTSIAEATAWVENGQLHQRIRNRSDQMQRIKLEVPRYIHTSKEYLIRYETKEVDKPLSWFKTTIMYAGGAAMIAAIVALALAAIRQWDKIKKLFNNR